MDGETGDAGTWFPTKLSQEAGYLPKTAGMNSPMNQDWLDEVARRRPTPEEAAEWKRSMASRPLEARRLEEELALNALLDGLPRPEASPRFAEGVLAAIDREEARPGLLERLKVLVFPAFLPARIAVLATACLAVAFGWSQFGAMRHARARFQANLAQEAAEVSFAAAVPGVSVFADYDAVRLLSTPVAADDMDLMEALRSDAP
jgi:hypothetical protein